MSYVNILHDFWIDVKCARFSSGSGKLTVSLIFAEQVVIFGAISIYLISIGSYWHRPLYGCKIFCV